MKGKRMLIGLLALILLLALCAFAFGCKKATQTAESNDPPATVEEATSRLRAAGYRVDSYDYEETDEEVALYGVVCELLAETDGEENYMEATIFESEERAKAYLQEFRAKYEEECAEDREDGEDVTFGQCGKWVYYGTKGAEKAFLTSAEGKKA